MSKESVEAIVGKAVMDDEFRESLFANPDEVLSEYELTEEEVASLQAIDFETMESFAGTLDERISKSAFAMIRGSTDGLLGNMLGEGGESSSMSSGGIPQLPK
jgi:hypothetical protein